MKLKEIDALDLQSEETPFTTCAEMLWPAVRLPLVRTWALQSGLGGDNEILRIRMQSFGDQLLRDEGSVGIGGIDKSNAERDCPPQHGQAFFAIRWLPPDALASQAHRPKAKTMDGKVSADEKSAALCGGSFNLWCVHDS